MSSWKNLERLVAATLAGVRSWDTDHDTLVVTDPGTVIRIPETGAALLEFAKQGYLELASIEVKNLKGPTVAQLEAYLRKNREKADRDGVRWNALVVKRKAGRGNATMALLVVPLEEFLEGV
jgi:hypothetical protein